jgi:hypothetical protein
MILLFLVQKAGNTAWGIRRADHVEHCIWKKLALTSPTSGGRSIGIVRSRTQATQFFNGIIIQYIILNVIYFI